MPTIRREQPRPAERFARADGLKCNCAFARNKCLECNPTLMNELEMFGVYPGRQDAVINAPSDIGGAFCEDGEVTGVYPLPKWVVTNNVLDGVHIIALFCYHVDQRSASRGLLRTLHQL
jgi:hypothetical protein